MLVITKVFPDEYHLHTLDLLLSAIARLNPHVDLKKIVIGLMDRLSSYAARESEANESIESKKVVEEEATARLLERLRLSKEAGDRVPQPKLEQSESKEKGTKLEESVKRKPESMLETVEDPSSTAKSGTDESKQTIPGDIRLYEIFYDQVVSLVKTRALPIQDTMALLVSLANLALYVVEI